MDRKFLKIKRGSELTPEEVRGMNAVARATNPAVPDDYLARYHLKKSDPVFYYFEQEGQITAFQAFSNYKIQTPVDRKPTLAIYIRLSYKLPELDSTSKDFARKTNEIYIKSQLGPFWKLRRFWVIYQTTNPRLYERTAAFFPDHFPKMDQPLSDEMNAFADGFLKNQLGYSYGFEDRFLTHRVNEDALDHWDIDDVWDELYAGRSEKVDQFFMDRGVIYKDEIGRFHWTGKGILFMGKYTFSGMLKKLIFGPRKVPQ